MLYIMNIQINGHSKEINGSERLNDLISQYANNCERVVAELNGEIIKKDQWESTAIKDGDTIELVSFVGGG